MKTRTKHRTTDWELYLSRREVTASESIGVTITTSPHHDADRIAVPDIVVRGGEVTLVRTVIYRYRHAKAFGGAHAAPAPIEVRWRPHSARRILPIQV